MTIYIASDHAGFEQKQILKDYISELGYSVVDLGPEDESRVDYPDFAYKVADSIGMDDFGVLVCGTGIGMAIAANKISGIRAANVTTPSFARLSREHNDANVLTVSGRFVDLNTNKEIVRCFLETPFGIGRHTDRIKKIHQLEML